jgi:uncharacterized beta-barrel protein YwiB (DUF1934 family)
MADGMLKIPVEFWRSLTEEESREVITSGWLNRKQCRRLWRMQDRQDAPPKRLQILVKKDDVMDLIKRGKL